jgi:hypothetical protein
VPWSLRLCIELKTVSSCFYPLVLGTRNEGPKLEGPPQIELLFYSLDQSFLRRPAGITILPACPHDLPSVPTTSNYGRTVTILSTQFTQFTEFTQFLQLELPISTIYTIHTIYTIYTISRIYSNFQNSQPKLCQPGFYPNPGLPQALGRSPVPPKPYPDPIPAKTLTKNPTP